MKQLFLIMTVMSIFSWANPIYTRNSVGIVIDTKTGLQWQDDYSDNGGNVKETGWLDAINYCENLTLGGYNDWRLPNINELYYLADRNKLNPAINSVFKNTLIYGYWSSTSLFSDKDNALVVYFSDGSDSWDGKIYTYYVRCVRGGE